MRKPCAFCGSEDGIISTRGLQDCVFCAACERFQYNAPKVETGRADRSITTVHNGLKANQRERIIERAAGRCELCGGTNTLHVDHVVSVKDGLEDGLTERELNHDDNLICLCAECNLGKSERSLLPKTYLVILLRRSVRAKLGP